MSSYSSYNCINSIKVDDCFDDIFKDNLKEKNDKSLISNINFSIINQKNKLKCI